MFRAGEYIYYGTSGLCRVDAVTKLNISGADQNRTYYCLIPLEDKGSTIYTPVDNQKVAMRRAMTREQAERLIRELPAIETLSAADEKQRERFYKQALSSPDCREWVRMIKTLRSRKSVRMAQGKKMTATETRYYQAGRERLFQEIALAVGIRKEDVDDYITDRLEEVRA